MDPDDPTMIRVSIVLWGDCLIKQENWFEEDKHVLTMSENWIGVVCQKWSNYNEMIQNTTHIQVQDNNNKGNESWLEANSNTTLCRIRLIHKWT